MDDQDLPFEFGSYCIVCDRAIPPRKPSPSGSASSSPLPSPGLTHHNDGKHHHSTKSGDLKRRASGNGQTGVRRNKSSSRLVHTHSRNRSHGHLTKLQPSTQIHSTSDTKGKQKEADTNSITTEQDASEQEAEALSGVGTLYCSLDCARRDHARTMTTTNGSNPSKDIVSPLPNVSSPQFEEFRRNSSASSLDRSPVVKPSSRPSSSQGQPFSLPNSAYTAIDGSVSPMMLDFSHRRNSRAQSYRPLAMQRVPSEQDQQAHSWHPTRQNQQHGSYFESSDSLSNMTADDLHHYGGRPPLVASPALSSLRSLTPIGVGNSSSGNHPQALHHRHAHSFNHGSRSLARPGVPQKAHSDGPRPSAFADPVAGIWTSQEDVAAAIHEQEERRARRLERQNRRRSQLSSPPPVTRVGWNGPSSVPNPAMLGLEDLHLSNRSASSSRPPLRSGSSASLALLGSSLGKASGSHFPGHASRLAQPQRSDSSVSLSGLNATGTILAPNRDSSTTQDTSLVSGSPATVVPPTNRHMTSPKHGRASLSIPPLGASPSSPSSQSAFSHSTAQSTVSYLSSSAGSSHHKGSRKSKGLTMTPSTNEGSSTNLRTPTTAAPQSQQQQQQRIAIDTSTNALTSTPGLKRPVIQHTAPTPQAETAPANGGFNSKAMSGGPVPPPPLLNPSLSYLAPNGNSNGQLSNKQRTFSWDDLGVKTYPMLDVDEMRARKQEQQGRYDERVNGAEHADAAPSSNGLASMTQTNAKPRKKLFHFALEDDE
ncbi:hypothetical protein OIO90_002600 [Microbotryomycetes sp. JL221]|nr:hypothetical protein OIO90_002600 [Microbotryomycetes sp. JL221]